MNLEYKSVGWRYFFVENELYKEKVGKWKSSIDAFGFVGNALYKGIELKIYHPVLAYLLTADEIEVKTPQLFMINSPILGEYYNTAQSRKTIKISGRKYMSLYMEAFYKGWNDLDKILPSDLNTLYNHKYPVFKNLHHSYFHKKHEEMLYSMIGWNEVRTYFPGFFNPDVIEAHGRCAGLVARVDELAKVQISLFDNFYNCYEDEDIRKDEVQHIFVEPEKAPLYLSLLRQVTVPVIDDNNYYKLGPKTKYKVAAWLDFLESKTGIINKITDRDLKARLLNNLIPGLGIAGNTLESRSVKSGSFKRDIELLFNQIDQKI